MKSSLVNNEHFFIPALILSVSIHGILIGTTGLMPSIPQVSVIEAPNSLEITVISQPLVSVLEEEIVTEEVIEDITEAQIPQEIVLSKRIKESRTEKNNQPTMSSQKSEGAVSKAKPLMQVNPAPPYPRIARQRGWEGTVRLSIFVDKNGAPNQVNIQRSSGFGVLDKAALKTVKKWKFSPARSGSLRLSSRITLPIQFTLIRE